jgi:hypothetical protein
MSRRASWVGGCYHGIVRDAELVDDALLRDGGGTVIHGIQWHV